MGKVLDNGKGSRKLETKIDHVVKNLFYFTISEYVFQIKINKKETELYVV